MYTDASIHLICDTIRMMYLLNKSMFSLIIYISKVKLVIIVEGDPKAPFSIATMPGSRERATPFPGLLHFTLDTHLIMPC